MQLLPRTDILTLRLVCQKCNQQCFRHIFTTLSLYTGTRGTLQLLKAISDDTMIRQHVQNLRIVPATYRKIDDARAFNTIITENSGFYLKSLYIYDPNLRPQDTDWIARLVASAPNLQKLHFEHLFACNRSLFARLSSAETFARLQELWLCSASTSEVVLSRLILRFKHNLIVLHLWGIIIRGPGTWPSTLRTWKGMLPKLRELKIADCKGETHDMTNLSITFPPLLYNSTMPDIEGKWQIKKNSVSYEGEYMDRALEMIAASVVLDFRR